MVQPANRRIITDSRLDSGVEALVKNTGGVGPLTSAALSATFVPVITPEKHGAVGDGVTNDLAAFTAALASASGAVLALRPGASYVLTGSGVQNNLLTTPNVVYVRGNGATLLIKGADGAKGSTDFPGVVAGVFNVFGAPATCTSVTFDGLTVVGENVSTFNDYQGAVIDVASGGDNLTVSNCTIKNWFGFPVHARSQNTQNVRMTDCLLENNGNSANINSDFTVISGNIFRKSGAVESSSSNLIFTNNVIYDAPRTRALSFGGRTAGASGTTSVIANNSFDTCAGSAISIGSGVTDLIISNNSIKKTVKFGITMSVGVLGISRVLISGNQLTDIGLIAGSISDRQGIFFNASVADVVVMGNVLRDGPDVATHSANKAIACTSATGVTITANTVSVAGASKHVDVVDCPATVLGGNSVDYAKVTGSGTTTFRGVSAGLAPVVKTANYTLSSEDVVFFNGTSLTATLPNPTLVGSSGRVFRVKNLNASALTVATLGGGKTIDGASTITVSQWAAASFVSDGTNWFSLTKEAATSGSSTADFYSKTADLTRSTANTGATLTADTDLVHAVVANAVYQFDLFCAYDADAAADIKQAFSVPAGATITWGQQGLQPGTTTDTATVKMNVNTASGTGGGNLGGAGVGTKLMLRASGMVRVGATAGNLTWLWAQQVADAAGTTVFKDTYMRVMRVS